MDKLFDACNECQQHNSLDTLIETIWGSILVSWWSPVFVTKIQILKYFEDCLTAIEVRPGGYEKSEKQKMFTLS